MNKRADQKKRRSEDLRSRIKKVLAIFSCIALLVLSVRVVDMSTRRMIMCNDDRYAMNMSIQEDNMLRVDIAGEKFLINIEPVSRTADHIASNTKRLCGSLAETIRAKLSGLQ